MRETLIKSVYKKGLILLLLIIVGISFGIVKVNGEEMVLVDDAPSAILMEVTTKTIVYQKDAESIREPASMTKIMTMILVMEAIKSGVLKMEDKLTASKNACEMGGTQIYLEVGEEMTVEDLLKAVAIASANDAAVVFAEAIGGSIENFVKMMNKKAEELKLKNTVFKNPNGLPEEGHYSCSYDMAIMGCYLLNNFQDVILKYTNTYEDYLRKGTDDEFWLVNTNKLIKLYPEVDGIKTGWTSSAGYCLTASMQKNGIRFVAVVMGASEAGKRNSDIMQMLNYGVSTYELLNIYKEGDIIETKENITLSPHTYNIIVTKDINVFVRKGETISDIRKEIIINNNCIDSEVGEVKIYLNGNLYDEVKLTIQEEVKKSSFLTILGEVIKRMFLGV